MIISISGPVRSGKSTIINLLKTSLPEDTIFVEDLFESCWRELKEVGTFHDFLEIYKDRDLLFMYISRICVKYKDIIERYKDSDKLVVMECCHLDFLIYTQLHSWYHYPLLSFQESTITKLLSLQEYVSRIYMTTPDDVNYPLKKESLDKKTTKTSFLRNRKLETLYYDLYRSGDNVYTLPPDLFSCDKLIADDLKEIFNLS